LVHNRLGVDILFDSLKFQRYYS